MGKNNCGADHDHDASLKSFKTKLLISRGQSCNETHHYGKDGACVCERDGGSGKESTVGDQGWVGNDDHDDVRVTVHATVSPAWS